MADRRLSARVRGVVQGVGFRAFVLRSARALRVTGAVANRRDGTVAVEAEGPEEALQSLLRDLEKGPVGSVVDRVESTWSDTTGSFATFDIEL